MVKTKPKLKKKICKTDFNVNSYVNTKEVLYCTKFFKQISSVLFSLILILGKRTANYSVKWWK